MKNQIYLTDEEKKIVNRFLMMKTPPVYKTDNTDRILFVELVEFDVCTYLLGKNRIDTKQYSYILDEYEKYLTQTDSSQFDKYSKEHFKLIMNLMDIFKKYYAVK